MTLKTNDVLDSLVQKILQKWIGKLLKMLKCFGELLVHKINQNQKSKKNIRPNSSVSSECNGSQSS